MIFDGVKVAVVGSRDYPLPELVKNFVASLPGTCTIVSGGARGVDTWAAEAAARHGLQTVEIPADWDRHGKKAGMLRNEIVVREAAIVIAFWDGKSRGTANSIEWAHKLGRSLLIIGPNGRIRGA
jgi:hypothetical protein